MNLVKNFALAVLLALGLAVNALAGEIPMPTGPSNPPPRTTATSEEVLGNSDAAGTTEISDDLFLEALAALLSIY